MSGPSPAGWHPDPLSRFEHRYWDGSRWTEHVSRGGQTTVDPIDASPAPNAVPGHASPGPVDQATPAAQDQTTSVVVDPMPTMAGAPAAYKLCPHCRSQNATSSDICPTCGKKYVVKKKWPWVVAAVFVLMAIGFVGCVAVVGTVAKQAVDALNAEQARHAITPSQFRAVPLGSTRLDVIRQLGKQPQNQQSFVSKGVVDTVDSSCIYYNKAGGSFGDRYQFCFQNDALTTKN